MNQRDREIDLEIVSNSWLSLNDPAGYDALVRSWANKIDGHADNSLAKDSVGIVDGIVARQLDPIVGFLGDEIDVRHVDPLESEIESTPAPAMILSPDGTVAATANDAETYFKVRPGYLAGTDWIDERSQEDFAALRRSILRTGNTGYVILTVRKPDGETALAEAYGLKTEKYAGVFTIVRSLALEWTESVGTKLEQAFGLTETEVEICRMLFALRDLDEVSKRRGVTRGTGRVQLKRIFAKMDIHAKADLIRLLATLCAHSKSRDDPKALEWSDPTGREALLTRPDGRKLAYTWIGAEDGREAIFVHGELPLFYLPPEVQQMLADADVKLICVSMPGHGSSDPAPRGVKQSDDALAALNGLIEHFGRPMPMVASYSGMMSAMALAAQQSPPVSALAVIGMPWNIRPDAYRDLPIAQKTLSQLAVKSPRMFKLLCRLGWRMMIREGPDFYLTRALSGSDIDGRLIREANMQPYLRSAIRHLVAQGYRAFARELMKGAEHTKAELLADLSVPLHWLVPADKPTCNEPNLRAARSMNEKITLEVVEDAGELLPYQCPDVFVRCMSDLVSENPAERFREHDRALLVCD